MVIRIDDLPLPCPVNAMWRSVKNGRYSRTVLSKRARERRDLIVEEIHRRLGGPPQPMAGSVAVQMAVVPRDSRLPDVDAHIKHLLDCLAYAGVYEDDRQVSAVYVERLPPRHPGTVTVEVWPVEDAQLEGSAAQRRKADRARARAAQQCIDFGEVSDEERGGTA